MRQTEALQADDIVFAGQIKSGNQLAFATVYDRHHKQMYMLAYRYLKNREMAEDAVQHVFVNFWVNRNKISEQQNIRGLLFSALKNHTLNIIRDRHRAISKNYEILMDSVSESEIERETEETVEMTSLIEKAVEALSPQRRQIFYLKIMEGCSNQEIADKLKISVNTVKVQYYHILKELKENVSKNMLASAVLIGYLFR